MARYSKERHSQSNASIVAAASRALRKNGLDRFSIGEVMANVGLTHGGFYAHFNDRAQLVEKAMAVAFEESRSRFDFLCKLAKENNDSGLIAHHYLSDERVKVSENGCPLAALSADGQRMTTRLRDGFESGVTLTRDVLREHFGSRAGGDVALAALVGALIVMRATRNDAEADAIRFATEELLRKLA